MKCPAHLCLETLELAPSAEWSPSFAGWCVLGVGEGQGYWMGEAGPRALGAGDMAILSPLREGIFRASQIGPVSLKFFRFSPELLDGLLTPTEREKFHKLALQPRYATNILAADGQAAQAFFAVAPPVRNGNALLARTELARILALAFARELTHNVPSPTTVLSSRLRLKALMNQVPEAEFLQLTARDLASRCGCSLTHLNRSFRRLFGTSLSRKQQEIRLLRARELLIETNARVEAIAAEAGYEDREQFRASFQRRFGVSPEEWRRAGMENIEPRPAGNGGNTGRNNALLGE
jgi:AraC-like DNA-binding protein